MGSVDISCITVNHLKRIHVAGGDVFHALKATDNGYLNFGEAYFSFIEDKLVKAWKKHTRMTLNLVVPVGRVKFIFFDDFGKFREEIIGEDNYVRLTVPPGIWFGFQGQSYPKSLILNIADIYHSPNEVERLDLAQINYKWESLK